MPNMKSHRRDVLLALNLLEILTAFIVVRAMCFLIKSSKAIVLCRQS